MTKEMKSSYLAGRMWCATQPPWVYALLSPVFLLICMLLVLIVAAGLIGLGICILPIVPFKSYASQKRKLAEVEREAQRAKEEDHGL